jgi:hypothetical protein
MLSAIEVPHDGNPHHTHGLKLGDRRDPNHRRDRPGRDQRSAFDRYATIAPAAQINAPTAAPTESQKKISALRERRSVALPPPAAKEPFMTAPMKQ